MKYITIGLLWSTLFILSCGNSEKNDSNSTSAAENEEVSSCFGKYLNQMDQMLTKADIQKHYQGDLTQAELDYDTISSPKYSAVIYSWKGDEDRTERKTYKGKDYGPKWYKIGIGKLHFYDEDVKSPIDVFNRTYRTMTAEEKAKAQEEISKELNKKTENEQTKKTAKKVTGSIIPQIKFDPVAGVGDAAVWDYMDDCLKVLKGKAIFDVIVDVSDNHEEDVKLAKALAKEVLSKCN